MLFQLVTAIDLPLLVNTEGTRAPLSNLNGGKYTNRKQPATAMPEALYAIRTHSVRFQTLKVTTRNHAGPARQRASSAIAA